jgi:hypothetical protein
MFLVRFPPEVPLVVSSVGAHCTAAVTKDLQVQTDRRRSPVSIFSTESLADPETPRVAVYHQLCTVGVGWADAYPGKVTEHLQ